MWDQKASNSMEPCIPCAEISLALSLVQTPYAQRAGSVDNVGRAQPQGGAGLDHMAEQLRSSSTRWFCMELDDLADRVSDRRSLYKGQAANYHKEIKGSWETSIAEALAIAGGKHSKHIFATDHHQLLLLL